VGTCCSRAYDGQSAFGGPRADVKAPPRRSASGLAAATASQSDSAANLRGRERNPAVCADSPSWERGRDPRAGGLLRVWGVAPSVRRILFCIYYVGIAIARDRRGRIHASKGKGNTGLLTKHR